MAKTCAKCKEEKPETAFHRHASRPDGLQAVCKPCKLAYQRVQPNRKKVLAASDARRAAQISASKAAWYEANQAAIAAHRKPQVARRYQEHRAEMIARAMRRNSRVREGRQRMSQAERAEEAGLYRFCQLFRGFQVDHIVPFDGATVSGLHTLNNLQVLTRRDNIKKGNAYEQN